MASCRSWPGACLAVTLPADMSNGMHEPYVLVVDDERLVRESLVRWLKSLGHRAVSVERADAAIDEITKQLPTVVIADVQMPMFDGLWLLEHIRARWPSLPVIMASGASLDEQAAVKAAQLGATDFIAKPFGRATLSQALLRATQGADPVK